VVGFFLFFLLITARIHSTCMVIWNYTVWYKIRGLYEHSVMVDDEETADQLLVVLRNLIPDNRKEAGIPVFDPNLRCVHLLTFAPNRSALRCA